MEYPAPTRESDCISRVILMASDHPGWTGLRATLSEHPDTCVVGEAVELPKLVTMALHYQPQIVLLAAERVAQETIPPLCELHAHHQVCKIVVVGDLTRPEHLVELARAGIAAHLRWSDIRLECMPRILGLLEHRDVLVLSQAAVRQLLEHMAGEGNGARGAVDLSARERFVLRGLADGLELQAIAEYQCVSLRTVKRAVASLEQKFCAPNRFVVAVRATHLGYVG